MNLSREFKKQVATLVSKGYPKLAQLSDESFTEILSILKQLLPKNLDVEIDLEKGTLPFVIVVKNSLVQAEQAMSLVEKSGKQGVTKLFPHTSTSFNSISEIKIPSSDVYLMINVDRGKETINLPPNTVNTMTVTSDTLYTADRHNP